MRYARGGERRRRPRRRGGRRRTGMLVPTAATRCASGSTGSSRDDDLRARMSDGRPGARGALHVGSDRTRHARGARRRRDRAARAPGRPMKFTVIGHSCLRIETSGPHDPGRPVAVRLVLLAVVVALPDGGRARARGARARLRVPHAPPLRSLPLPVDAAHRPRARTCSSRSSGCRPLAEEVRNLGFDEVMELPHAQIVQLAPGVRVASYQNGPDDSVFVVADGDARARRHQRRQDPRPHPAQRILDEFGHADVRVQELLVRAGLPGALHRRRSGRPRAHHPRHLPRRLGARGRRARAPLRRAVRQHGRVPAPREPRGQRAARRAGRGGRRVPAAAPALAHRGGADGPGRQLELRDRLRARRDRLVRRPREAPRGARGAGRGQDRDADRGRGGRSRSTTRPSPTTSTAFMHAFPPGVLGRFALRRPVVFHVPSSPLPSWVLDFSPRARSTACRHRRPTPPAS